MRVMQSRSRASRRHGKQNRRHTKVSARRQMPVRSDLTCNPEAITEESSRSRESSDGTQQVHQKFLRQSPQNKVSLSHDGKVLTVKPHSRTLVIFLPALPKKSSTLLPPH